MHVVSDREKAHLRKVAHSALNRIVSDRDQIYGTERVTYGAGIVCLSSALSLELNDENKLQPVSHAELSDISAYCLASSSPAWELGRVLVAARFAEPVRQDRQNIWMIERHLVKAYTERLSETTAKAEPVSISLGWAGAMLALGQAVSVQLLSRVCALCSSSRLAGVGDDRVVEEITSVLCALCATTSPFIALETKRVYSLKIWETILGWRRFNKWEDLSLVTGAAGLAVAGFVAGLNLGCDELKSDSIELLAKSVLAAENKELIAQAGPCAQDLALAGYCISATCEKTSFAARVEKLVSRVIRAAISGELSWRSPWDVLAVLTIAGIAPAHWVLACKGIPANRSQITSSAHSILRRVAVVKDAPKIHLGLIHLGEWLEPKPAIDAYRDLFSLVDLADALGYEHFWLAEHWAHGALWSTPIPLIPLLLNRTSRIRIGTAGLLLRHRNLVQLAADFNLLEHLFPNRVDLGVVSSQVGNPFARKAMERPDPFPDDFETRLRILLKLLNHSFSSEDELGNLQLSPGPPRSPDVWLFGAGVRNLKLAAALGLPYTHSIAHSVNASHDGPRLYDHLQSSGSERILKPKACLALAGSCAATRDEALANVSGNPFEYAFPVVLGTPGECMERLSEIQQATGVNDFVFFELATNAPCRYESLRLLARAVIQTMA